MTITTTTTTITIDESAGLQNATATQSVTGDADDNDILISALPTTFANRLTALGVTGLKEAALSGYNGSSGNTGADIVSVTPPGDAGTDLGFLGPDTNNDGKPDPLPVYKSNTTAAVDSGLQTTSGREIFLYVDGSNNNIVYGVEANSDGTANPNGNIAFAAYLDETKDANGLIIGAKIWTVITEPLAHTVDGSTTAAYDDSLDLTNKLFVGAEQTLTFNAANSPSGNNLFIMFAGSNTTRAIVATGMQPADQSAGANVSSGDTIVTSQVTDTTFGTNAQQIKPPSKTDPNGNGIWFTFLTDPVQDFTVPNLSPTEANLEADIQYGTFFSANEASFDVVQLQSGKSAVVKITAVDSPHDGATGDGENYVDGVLDDFSNLSARSVTITSVVLTGANTGTFNRADGDVAGVTWNTDGSVTLSGILAGTNIDYTTDGPHERVLIQNAGSGTGNASAAFDIGGFQITSATSSATEVGSQIKFEDDGPDVAVENIANGNLGEDPQNGTWTHAPGADGFKSLNITLDSYKIDDNTTVNIDKDLGTVTATDTDGNYVFPGSITDDFNGDGTSETVSFTLKFDADTNAYTFQLTTPPAAGFDTSQGTLKAGGPDAVQTLLLGGSESGNDDIVFFGAVPTAPPTGGSGTTDDLLDLVVSGEPDKTESDIEGLFPIPNLINSSTKMNVSTSGIGVNNNNLDGAVDTGETPAFAGTSITSGDESFVVNPETVVDKVTVFIDNSVGGYTPATEDLYYTVYYTDGTVSGPTDVTNPLAVPKLDPNNEFPDALQGHGQYFVIDGGDKQIDAVQLTMGRGTVKIPVIAFSVEFQPEPLQLDFTATLVDGDGDNHQDAFNVALA